VNAYAALVTLHVLLLVFWLGTDMGVFLGSFRLRDPRLSVEARLAIARLTSLLDMGPRTGVILSIPTGLTLAYSGGWARQELLSPAVLAVVWIVSLVWLVLVWRYFLIQQRAATGSLPTGDATFLRLWKRIDVWWRVLLATAIGAATVGAILGRGLLGAAWLDWKVALFGFVLVCGVGIRLAADDLPLAMGELVRSGSTPERESRVARALGRAYPWVIAIYLTVVGITYLSFAKPS
jgi:uncharacterized membrane protein